jgi:hypothetical protein
MTEAVRGGKEDNQSEELETSNHPSVGVSTKPNTTHRCTVTGGERPSALGGPAPSWVFLG